MQTLKGKKSSNWVWGLFWKGFFRFLGFYCSCACRSGLYST